MNLPPPPQILLDLFCAPLIWHNNSNHFSRKPKPDFLCFLLPPPPPKCPVSLSLAWREATCAALIAAMPYGEQKRVKQNKFDKFVIWFGQCFDGLYGIHVIRVWIIFFNIACLFHKLRNPREVCNFIRCMNWIGSITGGQKTGIRVLDGIRSPDPICYCDCDPRDLCVVQNVYV